MCGWANVILTSGPTQINAEQKVKSLEQREILTTGQIAVGPITHSNGM